MGQLDQKTGPEFVQTRPDPCITFTVHSFLHRLAQNRQVLERFGEDTANAQLIRLVLEIIGGAAGEENYRHDDTHRSYLTDEFRPAQTWHFDIGQDEVRRVGQNSFQSILWSAV